MSKWSHLSLPEMKDRLSALKMNREKLRNIPSRTQKEHIELVALETDISDLEEEIKRKEEEKRKHYNNRGRGMRM